MRNLNSSFTPVFLINACQRECECLEYRNRPLHIHVECVLACLPKLHENVVLVTHNQLKIFNWSLVNTPIEVENIRLHSFIPFRFLVMELQHMIMLIRLEFPNESILILRKLDCTLLTLLGYQTNWLSSPSIVGIITFIFRGPFDPRTLLSNKTAPISLLLF